MLFRPSSLQGRSDSPCTRNALLAGITDLKARLTPRTGSNRPVWQSGSSRHIVGASSARSLPHERAPSLHTQKGNWYDELLSVHELTIALPHSRPP